MKRKSIHLLGLMLVMFIVMACSLSGSGSGNQPASVEETPTSEVGGAEESVVPTEAMPVTGTGVCANPYYPVREGSQWSYTDTSTVSEPFTWTDTITSVRSDGFTLTSQISGVSRTQEWQCKPEGLVALELGGGPAGSLTTGDLNLDMQTQNVNGVTYPAQITAGDSWNYSLEFMGTMNIAGQSAEATGDTSADFSAVGVETVTVPAGTFEAMKVDAVTTITINATVQGMTVPVTFTGTTSSWYAQGVGWIKSVGTGNFAGQEYTETTELDSYNIP